MFLHVHSFIDAVQVLIKTVQKIVIVAPEDILYTAK